MENFENSLPFDNDDFVFREAYQITWVCYGHWSSHASVSRLFWSQKRCHSRQLFSLSRKWTASIIKSRNFRLLKTKEKKEKIHTFPWILISLSWGLLLSLLLTFFSRWLNCPNLKLQMSFINPLQSGLTVGFLFIASILSNFLLRASSMTLSPIFKGL